MRLLKRYALFLVLLALLITSFGLPVAAQSKSVVWERIDVNITVNPDGTFTVEEKLQIRFVGGPFQFGFRRISADRLVAIDNVTVFDEKGAYRPVEGRVESGPPRSFSVYKSGGDYYIRWFFSPLSDTTRTFRISYRVHGGLRAYEAGDQLWWQAVFPDRDGPVHESVVTVKVPGPVTAYDAYFVPADVEKIDEYTIRFRAKTQVPPGTAFEVRVQWPHGVIPVTPAPWQAAADAETAREERLRAWNQRWRPLANLFFLAISVLILSLGMAGIYLLWYLRGRDKPTEVFAEYLIEPPSNLKPALAGALIDERADMKEILATLVDLARRGYIEIEEIEEGWRGRDFRFYRKREDTEQLEPFEREVLNAILGGRTSRNLTDLKERFYRHIPDIKEAIYEALVELGYFPTNPERVRSRYALLGVGISMLGGLTILVAQTLLGKWIDLAFFPGLAIIILGAMMMVMANFMPRKTDKGAEEAAKWKAFRAYLARLQKLPDTARAQDLLERYLPYAIAFGVEETFLKRFESMAEKQGEVVHWPTWYHPYPTTPTGKGVPGHAGIPQGGAGTPSLSDASRRIGGGLSGLSRSLGTMLATASSVMTSAPSSSGGGGFSGGGSVGGGGGGGGGGGFG